MIGGYNAYNQEILTKQMQTMITTISRDKNEYQIFKGDTLTKIAKRFGTTVDELKKVNKLTSNTIKVGDKLKLK